MKRMSLGYDRVDELFDNASDRDQHSRRCPVTGSTFTRDDRLKLIKDRARRVLAAADWFDQNGPLDYRLPLTYADREALKERFDEGYIVALFARSLAAKNWRIEGHAPFKRYAAGILSLQDLGERILKTDPSLAEKYPPEVLQGLRPDGTYDRDGGSLKRSRRALGAAAGLY